jgi:endonuclease YncB( thermonuclease family)
VVVLVSLQTAYGAEHEVTRVHDGDTIRVKGDYGELTIRLVGIDAPEGSKKKREPGQPFSQKAKEYLADLVLNRSVDIGVCRLGSGHVNNLKYLDKALRRVAKNGL